ncbi:MAG: hypothetical protein QW756_03725 [Nitrososphaerota archaeon]
MILIGVKYPSIYKLVLLTVEGKKDKVMRLDSKLGQALKIQTEAHPINPPILYNTRPPSGEQS